MSTSISIGFTQENLEKLENSIAQGVKTVKYTDKEVTYRTLEDMLKIRDIMRKELGIIECRGNRKLAQTSKGL